MTYRNTHTHTLTDRWHIKWNTNRITLWCQISARFHFHVISMEILLWKHAAYGCFISNEFIRFGTISNLSNKDNGISNTINVLFALNWRKTTLQIYSVNSCTISRPTIQLSMWMNCANTPKNALASDFVVVVVAVLLLPYFNCFDLNQ